MVFRPKPPIFAYNGVCWFQSEFREEKLNLIWNWILRVGDGGPKVVIGRGCRRRGVGGVGLKSKHKAEGAHAFSTTSSTSRFDFKKMGGGVGGLLFQNSFLGQKHRRLGLGGTRRDWGGLRGTNGTRGTYAGLMGDLGGLSGTRGLGGTTGGTKGD